MGFPYVGVVLDDKAFPFPSSHHLELTSESHALLPHGQRFECQKSMLAVDAVCCARICGAFINAARPKLWSSKTDVTNAMVFLRLSDVIYRRMVIWISIRLCLLPGMSA